jgi:penicillin-binding protein 2
MLGIIAVSLFGALFARLWFLQVMTAPEYRLAADSGRVRVVTEQAPRGRILDRNGIPIVENRRTILVTVDWQRYTDMDEADQNALLAKLAPLLNQDQMERTAGTVMPGDPGAASATEAATTTTTAPATTGPPGSPTIVPPTSTPPTTAAPSVRLPSPPPITPASLKKRLADKRFSHFKPVPVAEDVSEQLEVYLTEHAAEFPTVDAARATVRQYPYGSLLAHVLGYVGQLDEDELNAFQNEAKPYEVDDDIGKTGVERALERELRGVPGQVRYEVDPRNRPVRVISRDPPVPGNDVYLTIDINLQYLTEKSLAAELARAKTRQNEDIEERLATFAAPAGSSVVIDPRNGQVLAMASFPTYDPAQFVNGISTAEYRLLADPELRPLHQDPLVNRTISGEYAPGSTWKLFSAYSGLATGQIQPSTVVDDEGFYMVGECGQGCRKQNANSKPNGPVDLRRSLTVSSDVYYYKLGDDLWSRRGELGEEAFQQPWAAWGFGEETGVELTGERPGRVPTPDWKLAYNRELFPDDEDKVEEFGAWRAGDSANVAVGQGDVLVTPLQLANGYATFANGGTRYEPQLVLQVTKYDSAVVVEGFEPDVLGTVDLPPEWRAPMLEGFKGVTADPGGTAYNTFEGFPLDRFPVGAKTGTAQVEKKGDSSLFAAFAPADAPRFVAVAILEQAGFGGDAAAPLVRRAFDPMALGDGTLASLPQAPLGGKFDVALEAEVNAPPPSQVGD